MTSFEAIGVEVEKALTDEVEAIIEHVHAKRKAVEILDEVATYRKKCTEGFSFCLNALLELSSLEPEIALDYLEENLAKGFEKLRSFKELSEKGIKAQEMMSWSKVLGFSDTTMEWLYKAAKHLFDEQRYHEAESAFFFLTALDESCYAFWQGLGHSSYHVNNFPDAIKAYAKAHVCDSTSVWPHIFAANAFEAIQDYHHELMALELAEQSSKHGKRERYFDEALKERINVVKEKLRKR